MRKDYPCEWSFLLRFEKVRSGDPVLAFRRDSKDINEAVRFFGERCSTSKSISRDCDG